MQLQELSQQDNSSTATTFQAIIDTISGNRSELMLYNKKRDKDKDICNLKNFIIIIFMREKKATVAGIVEEK